MLYTQGSRIEMLRPLENLVTVPLGTLRKFVGGRNLGDKPTVHPRRYPARKKGGYS